jgi:hypothetical protein
MTRLRTLHRRARRRHRRVLLSYRADLLRAAAAIAFRHSGDFDRTPEGAPVLYSVGDDFLQNRAHVRIRSTYADSRGRFYCSFQINLEAVDGEWDWQKSLLARVPWMLSTFLASRPMAVRELRPLVKRFYCGRKRA